MAISSSIGFDDEGGGIFGLPTVSALKESDSTTTGADGVSDVTQLPTMVVNEKPVEPTGIFTPGQLTQAPTLTGAVPAISPGGAVVGGGPTPIDVKTKAGTTITSEDLTGIIVNRIGARERQIGRPLSDAEMNSVVGDVMYEIWGPISEGGVNKPMQTGQGGIPLILPIPGMSPAAAAILTAAGLIFSGGKIARLKPSDPLGSIVDAGKGVVQTGQNVINVATGQDTLGNIWSGGTTPSTGSGPTSSGPAGQQTSSTGQLIIVGAGALGGSSGGKQVGPVSSGGQLGDTSGGAATPGALGGVVGGQTDKIADEKVVLENAGIAQEKIDAENAAIAQGKIDLEKQAAADEKLSPSETIPGLGGGGGGNISDVEKPGNIFNPPAVISGSGENNVNKTPPAVISTGPTTSTGGTTSGPTATTPIPVPTAFTFTKTTPGEVAMRDFEKEFGLTSSTLMGQAGQDLAKYYQQLQAQFTPSTLTALAGTSEQQLQNDLARYQAAMQGQLSPEDIRSAQQGAREAYAARGQVFSPGAIGAEILGRDQLMRQRQAEARQNLQQSMGNVGAAAQLQTGNIFAPFANLLAKTYGPTNEYANAVYDYNVNAYNAYQAAQENLAAYKEAASKGQEAQFIATFANFLANNGIQTTQNALSKFFQALLPKG